MCYDGASNMSGIRNGVAKRIQDKEPRAVFTHCYGHALSLAAGDTIRRNTIMKRILQTTYEITKPVKYSPHREALFREIQLQDDNAPGTQAWFTLKRFRSKTETFRCVCAFRLHANDENVLVNGGFQKRRHKWSFSKTAS